MHIQIDIDTMNLPSPDSLSATARMLLCLAGNAELFAGAEVVKSEQGAGKSVASAEAMVVMCGDAPAEKKRGRPKKEEAAPAVEAAAAEPAADVFKSEKMEETAPRKLTLQECRDALVLVNKTISLDFARDLVLRFAKNVTSLPEDKYEEFFRACRDALEGKMPPEGTALFG